jgi:outer membrane protein
MRGLAIAVSLASVLSAGALYAQTPPAGQQPPSTPSGQAQPPAQPRPAAPAPAPAPAAAAQPPLPFPAGAKIAYINPQRIFQESAEGKAGLTRVQAFIQKKQTEGQDRQKKLAADQQKLQTSGGVMNEAARAQLEKDIEKQQVDGQRFQQDAQAEINEIQTEVQNEFIKKVSPIIEAVAKEKGLQLVFDLNNAGLAYFDPALDLSGEVIKKLDGGKPAATPKP